MPSVYIETYGCQMNVADSEVVAAILQNSGYNLTASPSDADLVLINTCSIRENAENRIYSRVRALGSIKSQSPERKIGIIGCMAERLKENILSSMPSVSLIAGPDSYRELPAMLKNLSAKSKSINTELSLEETYADINPVRMDENNVSAFISIMRGCDNFCSYCVVPYTRGRERSRAPKTIMNEIAILKEKNYKEITLLGQNVNSYRWEKNKNDRPLKFPELLAEIAQKNPELRIRFATSHPADFTDSLIREIAAYENICNHIHLPVQSGSNRVLKRMNRKYQVGDYLEKIEKIKNRIPGAALSTDLIAGFCSETEEDHKETLELMNKVKYDFAYMFKYSERPGTFAAKKYSDDVPEKEKTRRLNEIIELQNEHSLHCKKMLIGQEFDILVEGTSKKSQHEMFGRTSMNHVAVFPGNNAKPGDLVRVRVKDCTSATLLAENI